MQEKCLCSEQPYFLMVIVVSFVMHNYNAEDKSINWFTQVNCMFDVLD